VGEYLQIFRARVPQQSVAALVEIRPAAIAEAQRLCPELLGPNWSGSTMAPGWTC
jgi:hypothetical protein